MGAIAQDSDEEWNAELQHLHIYTDRSASNGHASWAFCVLEDRQGKKLKMRGSMQGMVTTSQNSDLYMGMEKADNYSAEVSAQAWAAAWLLRPSARSDQGEVPATIWYDSTAAAQAVQTQTREGAQAQLVTVASTLATTAASLRPMTWRHVAGHSPPLE